MQLIAEWFTWLVGWALPFLFVLTLVVFFHELGHFLVARWNGVGVAKFAIGFGPDLCRLTDRHGTIWAVCAIPLGGYVKFIDDMDAASHAQNTAALEAQGVDSSLFFSKKKVWQRAAVVAAGPLANFLLAIVILAGLFMVNGRDIVSAKVDALIAGGVAERAGFQTGDLVIRANDQIIESFADLQRFVSDHAGVAVTFVVERNGAPVAIHATPALLEVDDGFGGKQRIGQIGIQRNNHPDAIVHKSYGPLEALGEGILETGYILKRTALFFAGLVAGRESVDQLGGPIRIADISGQVATLGFSALISLTALLSVSIGFMNLLPIPVLDGGHLVFYALEAIRGKPVSEKAMNVSYRLGLMLLLGFMVFVTTLDLSRIFS